MISVIAVIFILAVVCNVYAYRTLVRLHPRRRTIVIALVVIGNVVWPFLAILERGTPVTRLFRALFGPPWFAWLAFVMLYSAFMVIARRRFASRIFLWTTLLALVAGVHQALVPLRVETVRLDMPGGIRIVELADLHVGLFTRPSRLKKIFETATSLRPDVIVLAGDSIDDDPYFIPKLLEGASHVPPGIPVIAVLGNHEMYGAPEEVIARLRGSRIHLLVNEGVAIKDVWIAGIGDFAARSTRLGPNMSAALAGRGTRLPIVLAHQPKAFPEAQRLKVPLTIVAHTHGGQFGFRPLRWSLAGVFLPFHMGLYTRGPSKLYVNTGTGYWLLPWRLGMTPEITVFDLASR